MSVRHTVTNNAHDNGDICDSLQWNSLKKKNVPKLTMCFILTFCLSQEIFEVIRLISLTMFSNSLTSESETLFQDWLRLCRSQT